VLATAMIFFLLKRRENFQVLLDNKAGYTKSVQPY